MEICVCTFGSGRILPRYSTVNFLPEVKTSSRKITKLILHICLGRGGCGCNKKCGAWWLPGWFSSSTSRGARCRVGEIQELLSGGHPVRYLLTFPASCSQNNPPRWFCWLPFVCSKRYLEGGVESGLKPLDTTFKPKLLHIKGKRRPVIRQVNSSYSEGALSVEELTLIHCYAHK